MTTAATYEYKTKRTNAINHSVKYQSPITDRLLKGLDWTRLDCPVRSPAE